MFELNVAMTGNSPFKEIRAIFSSKPPDIEHACLPEDFIEVLTDEEHVGSE
jgi:hypothetical protein